MICQDLSFSQGDVTKFGNHNVKDPKFTCAYSAESAAASLMERNFLRSQSAERKEVMGLVSGNAVEDSMILQRQPPGARNYIQVKGSNRRVSMYSKWRLSKHNPNPVGLTSRMLL